MKYAKVVHSHIVPAGYLRSWAVDDRIAMRLIGDEASRLIGLRDAGVRTDFYKRTRPGTGEAIYDTEWSLRELENVALPVVSRLPELWPLTEQDKVKVGQFLAAQYVRGPAFKTWHERFLQNAARNDIQKMRSDPQRYGQSRSDMTPAEAVERAVELLFGDTWRHLRMLSLVGGVTTLLASMHWTLVEFDQPRLVTSDNPVVAWPTRRGSRSRPEPNDLDAGLSDSLEAFVPVGPAHLLLMTWRDRMDQRKVVSGLGRHLATANAFVAANADRQWFHQPGVNPWRFSKGARDPLSVDLVPGYDVDVAKRSSRRSQAAAHASANAGKPPNNDPITVITVTDPI